MLDSTIATPTADAASQVSVKEGIEQFKNLSFNDLVSDISQRLVDFAIDLAIAIAVFYIGKFAIKRIYRIIAAILLKRKVDSSLCTFILSFVNIVLYFILIVTVIGILGIETSSFLALFASAGVAIGMALSGTLQNFAGGVLILLLKPYKVGDYIEAQGYAGTVREILIFHTIITTFDNKAISIPNGGLSTSSINNWSREEYRRVAWEVSISYGDSVDVARKAILSLFENDSRILKPTQDESEPEDPTMPRTLMALENMDEPHRPGFFRRIFGNRAKVKEALQRWEESHNNQLLTLKPNVVRDPYVTVEALGASSVDLKARAWVKTADYWSVFYDYNELIYSTLPNHGINFPFPQMDIHLKQEASTPRA